MPIDRKKKLTANKVTKSLRPMKTERTHEENQERAYIAASRRSDRSLEARVESARRASEIHKKRTGRAFRITEQDVMNEEMYREEDDEIPARSFARGIMMRNIYSQADSRLHDYLNHTYYMGNLVQRQVNDQYPQTFPNAHQFPIHYPNGILVSAGGVPPVVQNPYSGMPQGVYNPLHMAQLAEFRQLQQQQQQQQQKQQQQQQQQQSPQQRQRQQHQQQQQEQSFRQQYLRPDVNFRPLPQGPIQHIPIQLQSPQQIQGFGARVNQNQPILPVAPGYALQQNMPSYQQQYMALTGQSSSQCREGQSPVAPAQLTPQASPVTVIPRVDLGPLSATLPTEAQQFIDPAYSIFPYHTDDVESTKNRILRVKDESANAPEVREEGSPRSSINEDDGTKQLETPAESISGMSVQSATGTVDDCANLNSFSPGIFNLPFDTGLSSSFLNYGSPAKILPQNVSSGAMTTGSQSSANNFEGFEHLCNFDTSFNWPQDWNQDPYVYQK